EDLDRLRGTHLLAIGIRHRGLADLNKEAERYLSQLTESEKGLRETLARGTRIMQGVTGMVRYPLIPRAKILVVASDDLLRTFLANAVRSAGHEVLERKSVAGTPEFVDQERPHVVILDLEESQDLVPELRTGPAAGRMAIIACSPEGKTGLLHKALTSGL